MADSRYSYDSPAIAAPYRPVVVESLVDVNGADSSYFDHLQYNVTDKHPSSRYSQKEAQYISSMNRVLEEGHTLMTGLYAFRSCGRAIPQVQSQDQENKNSLYVETCRVLQPGIKRMIELMTFRDKLVAVFTEALTGIIPDIKDRDLFPSESFLLTLANLLDLTVCMDTMKNFKGSMSNDLSMYKRYKSTMTKDHTDPEVQLLPKLAFFLASKDQFGNDIKTSLATMSNTYEEVFCDMINLCVETIETNHYLIPTQKHVFLRATAFAICLIDGEGEEADYVKKKKFKVDRVGKLLKANSIVPLFGDLCISLGDILVKSSHWNHAKWDLNRREDETKQDMRKSYLLVYQGNVDVERHKAALVHVKKSYLQIHKRKIEDVGIEEAKDIYKVVVDALKLLSSLTNKVLEQSAWKYLNPNTESKKSSGDANLTAIYEQVVQFNYSHEEKRALVQYISMIKSLSGCLYEVHSEFQAIIDMHISSEIQSFTKNQITEYYNSALKKKKPTTSMIKSIKDGLLDAGATGKTVKRSDPVSLSQLFFARATLDLMFSEKSKGMKGGLMKEKNFKDSQITEIQQFYDESFYYPNLLALSGTIQECSDLSNLWFKEFYLELTKQVQFRTNTSLPWILADYVLDSQETDVMQDLFVPLDLYNDAAAKTLLSLKSQYIFNEIEAEVNLCFDRFMFSLGKKLFIHYKKIAALQLLDSESKTGKSFWSYDGLQPNGYENILLQRNVKILGRSIDISKILSQMVNQYLRLSIDTAITRFESSDITYVLELESLIETSRRTHALLSKFMDLENFDDLLIEVDECIVPCENNGRIITHATQELVRDVVPNFGFNNVTLRFLRSSVFYAEPVQRPNFPNPRIMYLYGTKQLSIEYSLKHGQYKDYVGEIHFACLYRLIGYAGVSVVAAALNNHVSLIMDHTLHRFFESIIDICPFKMGYPSDQDSLAGLFDYMAKKYESLSNHKSLKGEMLQAFREIGNASMVTKLIEISLFLQTSRDKVLINDIISYDSEAPCYINKIGEVDQSLNEVGAPISYTDWTTVLRKIVRGASTKPLLSTKLLRTISTSLRKISEYKESENILEGKSFARVWTALSFVANLPEVAGERSIRELFGDGLPIAGTTMLFIFGQSSIFTVLDINKHLVRMSEGEREKPSPRVKKYLASAAWFNRVFEEHLSTLRNT